ncbi:hypothetical protein LEL_04684 [Akanthomyces lecanii RCEF 1005]|uniref:Uncharacterized protein n=1 Tax=Akanthomyces lecanii RCEF 1005 TaxID=1081108 RepID=A0A168HJJ6_CORDF|nr:hypothetical protein LEL_04684 [Akanthomyces lecanii RCEF 1005]
MPNEILMMIIDLAVQSKRRRNESPVLLRPKLNNTDLVMFKRIFVKDGRRKRCLVRIDVDFDLRSTPLDVPGFFHGTEEQRAIMVMRLIDTNDPPLLSHRQFDAQLRQDNIRMTTFLVQLFRHLKRWKKADPSTDITLRLVAENPTY